MKLSIRAHSRSISGRRKRNEDACLMVPEAGVFAVLDGMGGYAGGAVASTLGAEVIGEFFGGLARDREGTWPRPFDGTKTLGENRVDAAVCLANRRIRERREGALSGMGTTVALVSVSAEGAVLGHVGDSRIYRLRQGALEQLTRDHSLYEHLREGGVRLPPLAEFVHANVITRALGPHEDERPELRGLELLPGDRLLLCTDGLSGALSDAVITHHLTRELGAGEAREGRAACDELVAAAYVAGSSDNITAIVLDVG